jgi:hypothetical protein
MIKKNFCKFCKKTLRGNPNSLVAHVTRVHTKEKRFACSLCKKEFHSKEELIVGSMEIRKPQPGPKPNPSHATSAQQIFFIMPPLLYIFEKPDIVVVLLVLDGTNARTVQQSSAVPSHLLDIVENMDTVECPKNKPPNARSARPCIPS